MLWFLNSSPIFCIFAHMYPLIVSNTPFGGNWYRFYSLENKNIGCLQRKRSRTFCRFLRQGLYGSCSTIRTKVVYDLLEKETSDFYGLKYFIQNKANTTIFLAQRMYSLDRMDKCSWLTTTIRYSITTQTESDGWLGFGAVGLGNIILYCRIIYKTFLK